MHKALFSSLGLRAHTYNSEATMTDITTQSETGLEVLHILLEGKNYWKPITHTNSSDAHDFSELRPVAHQRFRRHGRNPQAAQTDDYPGGLALAKIIDWQWLELAPIKLDQRRTWRPTRTYHTTTCFSPIARSVS